MTAQVHHIAAEVQRINARLRNTASRCAKFLQRSLRALKPASRTRFERRLRQRLPMAPAGRRVPMMPTPTSTVNQRRR